MTTERLEHGEDDLTATCIDGQALDEVEASVRTGIVLLIKSVEVHHAQELLTANRSFIEVLHVGTDRVVAVGDIEFEFLRLHTGRTEGVDIFHHQVPSTVT